MPTTDPSAERLAALQASRPTPGAPMRHAQAAKILTAGLSTSMALGVVAYLAHSANVQAERDARLAAESTLPTTEPTTEPTAASTPAPSTVAPPPGLPTPTTMPASVKPATPVKVPVKRVVVQAPAPARTTRASKRP